MKNSEKSCGLLLAGEAERAILLYETDPAYWERALSEHPNTDEWTSSAVAVASLVQKMRAAGQPEAEPNQIADGSKMVNADADAAVAESTATDAEPQAAPMLTAGTQPTGQAVAETESPTADNAETETALPAEPQPVGRGAFGDIYDQFKGKAKEAINFLKKLGSGEAVGALSHKEIGDISLVWGNEKAGLKKILRKHPDVADNLQSLLNDMHVTQSSDNRIVLESDTHKAVVSKMLGKEKTPQWLLTAYEKKKKASGGSSGIVPEPGKGKQNGTAPLQDTSSTSKDTPSVAKKQEDAAEKDIDEAKIGAALEALKDTSKAQGIRLAMKLSDKELAKAHEMAKDRRVLIQLEAVMESREEKRAADKTGQAVADAAKEVDVNPTEAQKEAGNYRKGHVRVDGMDISIEQPKGSVRRGTDADGKQWESEMHDTYGYIRGTVGVDGDHIDVFLSDHPDKGGIFVVDQVDPKTGKFDEHKVMYGYADEEEAKAAYLANYEKGWRGLGAITAVSREDFEKWIASSHRKTKPFSEYKIAQAEPKVDAQGNPLNADGTLRVEKVRSVDEITDADFTAPTRSIELPKLPGKVDAAIGADGKTVVIKKNILVRNAERHPDITASQSRDILRAALYSPDLYGQNQKAKRPYNWVVINTKDSDGKNRLVLLEISPSKDSIEIVHWHYVDERGLAKIKRQAESEDGQLLILPSKKLEEVGALSDPTLDLSSEGKGSENISDEKEGKQTKYNGYLDGKTKLTASAIDRNLSKRINIGGAVKSIAEHIEGWHKDGGLKVEANEYMPEPNRRRWNRMYQDEQEAWEAAHSKPKTQYLTGDGEHMYELGKTAYDYAKWLLDSDAAAKQSAGEVKHLSDSGKVDDFGEKIAGKLRLQMGKETKFSPVDKDFKRAQLDIIHKTNPMLDDYHTGIRTVDDIKTFKEAYEEAKADKEKYDYEQMSSYPDETDDILDDALEGGKITVYSSKPIKNGNFVTPSRMQAEDYAGGGRVYVKTVPLGDVAWINVDEGQYAKVGRKNRFSLRDSNEGRIQKRHEGSSDYLAEEANEQAGGRVALPTAGERALRDAVVERMRESGLDVITDDAEGQRVLDEVNGNAKLSAKKRRALETASLGETPRSLTVVSSADGANVVKNIDELATEFDNSTTQPKTFVGDVAKALGANRHGSTSEYATFETRNGRIVTIRLANHNATVSNFDNHGESEGISIVVSPKQSEGIKNDGSAHIVEYYYNALKLRRADGKPLAEILRSIKQALYSGEFTDTTGLAERQEVNADDVVRYNKVYHGSAADFDRFDHSHMGEGEGASEFLSSLGFVGTKYPADFMRGGRADGKKNYVIFNEADARITDHVRFFRTADGEAYGFTVGGKIYIDPRVAKADTPIHEYSHLWSAAMREANPGEWANIVELMRGTGLWDEVKARYPELETDDDIADEVLAHYSGRRGAERLRAEQQRIIEGDATVLETAAALSALERVKEALRRFWKGVADFLHIHFTTAEEVADRVLHDLLQGFDPRKYGKSTADDAVKFRKGVVPGSEVHIVDAAAEHGFANYAAAKRWARENIARTYGNDETGGKGEIRISNKAIEKFLSESAVKNSESRDAHLSTLRVLPEVIRESVDAEQHPDYKKDGGGKRAPENGVNPDVTIHRLYGAMRIGGKLYRVKVTLKEDARNPGLAKKAYSYEATKIELFAGTLAKPEGDDPNTNNSISVAKLLNGVEKSYGNGEKLIDADGFAALPKSERRAAVEREVSAVDVELGTHTVVADTAELSDAMRDAVERGGGCAYYDPATGETVVLADRALSAADVRASVVHENIGHKSLDELLGGKVGDFYREVAEHIATAEELDALRKDYPEADGARLGSEWMAHLSETEAWKKRQKRA